jgi:type II secretory pathway component PulC
LQQNKTIPAAVWIACLTMAAYVLAQAAAVLISRSFDAASRNAEPVAQSRSERAVPPLPRINPSDGNKTTRVPKTAAGSGVKVKQVSDTEWIVDRASMLANTRNLNRFLMQARAVPYMKQGRIVGFRITRISQGSLYEKIGLRNGDVLLRVNMRNLDDPAKLLSLYQEMRNKRHISILLSRNGQNQTFHYDIR